MAESDPRIDKRRVTMTNFVLGPIIDGQPSIDKHEAVDFVNPEFLDAYVDDARTRWRQVEVSTDPDAGPGGYDGDTNLPDHLTGV